MRLSSRAVQAAAEPRWRRLRLSRPRKPEHVVYVLERVVHEDLSALWDELCCYKNNIVSDVHEGSVALNS